MSTSTSTPKPVTDLSPRVVELARIIDRLGPGTHIIQISKADVRAMDWEVSILSAQTQHRITLPKKVGDHSSSHFSTE